MSQPGHDKPRFEVALMQGPGATPRSIVLWGHTLADATAEIRRILAPLATTIWGERVPGVGDAILGANLGGRARVLAVLRDGMSFQTFNFCLGAQLAQEVGGEAAAGRPAGAE